MPRPAKSATDMRAWGLMEKAGDAVFIQPKGRAAACAQQRNGSEYELGLESRILEDVPATAGAMQDVRLRLHEEQPDAYTLFGLC